MGWRFTDKICHHQIWRRGIWKTSVIGYFYVDTVCQIQNFTVKFIATTKQIFIGFGYCFLLIQNYK